MKLFICSDYSSKLYITITASLLCIEPLLTLSTKKDILTPYTKRHGSALSHEDISRCQPVAFKGVPHELHTAIENSPSFTVQEKSFLKHIRRGSTSILARGHYVLVKNPTETVSVLEPGAAGGCRSKRMEAVRVSSKQKQCTIAVNAGFFHPGTGQCLGNVVSDGHKVQDSNGVQNAHFGIKKDGSIFVGYLSEEEMKAEPEEFLQLVGGVVWLVRNGKSFVNESMHMECENTEETGSMDRFVNVMSARTAIGHDSAGNIILCVVDGKSDVDGVNLWEMASLIIELGAVNAVNLDGGGSATMTINGTVVNYPSDECDPGSDFDCERRVSTIICIHTPESKASPNRSVHEHYRCRDTNCSNGCTGPECSQMPELNFMEENPSNSTVIPCRVWAIACFAISAVATVSLLLNCALCCFSARFLGLCAKTRRPRNSYKTVNLGELLVTSSDEETETILHHK